MTGALPLGVPNRVIAIQGTGMPKFARQIRLDAMALIVATAPGFIHAQARDADPLVHIDKHPSPRPWRLLSGQAEPRPGPQYAQVTVRSKHLPDAVANADTARELLSIGAKSFGSRASVDFSTIVSQARIG